MSIGTFLRELESKRLNMKQENAIVRERLTRKESAFSYKAFWVQIAIGVLGIVIM